MRFMECKSYLDMLQKILADFSDWEKFNGKAILISGATGMLGSLLVDAMMLRNQGLPTEAQCKVIALGRNRASAEDRFASWMNNRFFRFYQWDVSEPIRAFEEDPDFLVHGASTTHPVAYATEPISTIMINVLGTQNMLELAVRKKGSRFLLLSSIEVYGENRGDVQRFTEDYYGYIDCNTLRAGYPEGKRVSEALCHAYITEKGADAVILRLPRSYGPTMKMNDTKALSQFIKKGLAGENIVLKSAGTQFYSYAFASDAVLGMLYTLTRGTSGEAYNLADSNSDITLKELAQLVADTAGTEVIYELPDIKEQAGYSTVTKAVMDSTKLKGLGWVPGYSIEDGIKLTMEMLKYGNGVG